MSLEIIADNAFPYFKLGDFYLKVLYDLDKSYDSSLLDFAITTNDSKICVINERDISKYELINKLNSKKYISAITNATLVRDIETNSAKLISYIEDYESIQQQYTVGRSDD
ncbi:hypothetical protein CMO86_00340 [Candidatus Woesearchaeota archaeon]|nr:hypothetical protein [Candidatus Woesearchaeota archaeon]|tara:strand:- start:451 stop:783 length:333 start_codon:yes stop_codon:yes gene_type:complete